MLEVPVVTSITWVSTKKTELQRLRPSLGVCAIAFLKLQKNLDMTKSGDFEAQMSVYTIL